MIRRPMETNNQVQSANDRVHESKAKTGKKSMPGNTSLGSAAFFLEEQPQRWGSVKLWTLTFDLQGEKVNKLSKKSNFGCGGSSTRT